MTAPRTPLRAPIMVAFEVFGRPIPQGSKTVVRTKRGATMRDDNAATLKPWRAAVAEAATRAMTVGVGDGLPMLHGPVRLRAEFRFERPRSHYGTGSNYRRLRPVAPRYVTGRPDLDKLLRAIGDGITGIVVADDAQIVALTAIKSYGEAGASVRVEQLQL
jgi:Holliday junction resolvase RusA-like endonuclease